jgi:alanyl-tRNA synthetase
MFKIVGETTDGKIVVSGLFRLFETEGIPLDMIFEYCRQHNMMPSWIDFYQECRSAGMKHERILSKLEEAVADSFGKEFRKEVISKLDMFFKLRE